MKAWVVVVGLLFCASVFGDEIYFKDGTSVHCKIVSETPGRIVYTVKGVRHEVARATVERIERTRELKVDVHGNKKEDGTKVEGSSKDEGIGQEGKDKGDESSIPDPDKYKDGYAKGLAAHYYVDPTNWDGHWMEGTNPTVDPKEWTFTKYLYTAVEPHINHHFIRKGWFSVRWQGKLIVGTPGKNETKKEMVDVEFEIWADDGCRLIIDGETLVDSWIPCWEKSPESHRVAKAKLLTGKHDIVIEYFQGESLKHDDKDPIKLYWKCEALNIPAQLIPAAHFEHSKLDLVPKKGRLDRDDVLPVFKKETK